jgi:hypothetical protein
VAAGRSGLNPTTNSVGFTAKLITVQSVSADGKTAVCVDRLSTQTTVSMLVQRSKGPLPQPGESWLIAQDLGMWAFAAFVAATPADFAVSGGSSGVTVSAQPPQAPSTGALWLNAASGFELLEWTGLTWIPLQFGTSALADGAVTAAKIAPGTITSEQIAPDAGITAGQVAFTAGDIGGTRVFKSTAQPSGMQPGDLWLNPDSGNMLSEWTGNEWVSLLFGAPAIQPGSLTTDQLATEAGITAGQVAFTYKDLGGMSATIATAAPAAPAVGDLWFDSTNGYALRQWNGTAWVPYQFGTNAIAAGSVTAELIAANAILAGKIAAGAITADKIAAGIIIAGVVDGTVIEGARFIADGTSGEVLAYTGAPASGNMNLSVSPVGGSDGLGNSYRDGVSVYDAAAYIQFHVNPAGPYPAIELVSGIGSEADHPAVFVQPLNTGSVNESEQLSVLGPASTWDVDQPSIILQGSAKDGSSGSGVLVSNGRISGRLPIVQTANPNGVAQAPAAVGSGNATNISSIWTVPAGDARPGTLYRIKGFGYSDGAGNQIVLRVVGYGGTFLAGVTIAAGAFGAAGATLDFDFEAVIRVQTVSATVGAAAASFSGNISIDGQPLTAGVSTQNSFGFNSNSKGTAATGLNTLGASLFAVQAYFPSSPSPSNAFVECTYDSFERWGP